MVKTQTLSLWTIWMERWGWRRRQRRTGMTTRMMTRQSQMWMQTPKMTRKIMVEVLHRVVTLAIKPESSSDYHEVVKGCWLGCSWHSNCCYPPWG